MILGVETKILLFDGSFKNIENITTEDLIISTSGNIVRARNIEMKKQELLVKIEVRHGRPITCGKNTEFLTLDKNNCRRPNKDLKSSRIIESVVNKGFYIMSPKTTQINNFLVSKQQAWLLGLFASNGRVLYKYNRPSSLTFFSKHQGEVKRMIEKSFANASVRKDNKLISVSGKNIVDFFMVYVPGVSSKEKRLSSDVIWMDKNLQLEFLKGWFSNKGVHTKFNTIIGSTNSKFMTESISFILSRLGIPYCLTEGFSNSRFVINGGCGDKLYHKFLSKNTNIEGKGKYRNFDGNILFSIKKISTISGNSFKLDIDDGVIANGYAVKSNNNKNYINICSNCAECKKIMSLSQSDICYKCRTTRIGKPSWRYELKCKSCGKNIKNKIGCKKFCSTVCRRKVYDPLAFKNRAANYFGYVNKGYLSYPQNFIFCTIKDKYNNYNWTFNDRTIIRNPNTGYPMELDIYCKSLDFAIEFDGKQHFEGNKLQYTQQMDMIKNQECEKQNITLLRIAYNESWKNKDWITKKVGELLNGNS